MHLLQPGDAFPDLSFTVPGGQELTVPELFERSYGVLLLYRGSWCTYCNHQLRAFGRARPSLADVGIRVAALSVDDETTTSALMARHRLTFPVGFGADAHAIADLTGAFLNQDPLYLQSTGFVLDPDGQVMVSVYSTGAIGRLIPEDVAGYLRYVQEHGPTPAASRDATT